jgi:hypothetical protein
MERENCDIVVQTDTSSTESWVEVNGGFYFVRNNNATQKAFQLIQQCLFVHPELEDQQAFGTVRYTHTYTHSLC